jgi:hypothetical protein
MKCPNCNYTSFDHNEICPKCKQDISSERDRMKHPKYKENPPFLLGALIGESEESGTKSGMGYTKEAGISSGPVSAEEVSREDEFVLEPDFHSPKGYDVERPVDSESLELDGEIDLTHLDALLEDDSGLHETLELDLEPERSKNKSS